MKPYAIDLPKLKPGDETFRFDLDDRLLAAVGEDAGAGLFDHPRVQAEVRLSRTSALIDARFHLTGTVELACDRCLAPWDFPIDAERRIVFSFDPSVEGSEDADAVYLDRSALTLDLAQDFFDFLALEIPYRRVPPPESGHVCALDALAVEGVRLVSEDELPQQEDAAAEQWSGLAQLKDRFDDPQ